MRYMSPEALREEPLTPATDIYSLAITMWQMRQRRLPYQSIACNEVVAYQVVKNKLRPDCTVPNNPANCTSTLHTTMHRQHKCYCANLTAEEITYHSLVQLTNVLNRTKQPEEQLRFSDCSAEELQQSAARRPFASLNAKVNVMRNLSAELNCSKSPVAQKSPTNKGTILIPRQQQQRTKGDVVDLLVLFENIFRLNDHNKEQDYEKLYKACWCDEPKLRPNALLLQKRLLELL